MGKTFEFDFQNKEFVIKDGKLVPTDDIRVWIEKILRTQKDRYLIYQNTDYGTDLEDLLVGYVMYPRSFYESEVRREIEEALYQNERINKVQNVVLKPDNTIELEVLYDGSGLAATITI